MTIILASVLFAVICLVVFFATGRKTPVRPVSELPKPSLAVKALIDEKRTLDAIKLYRQDTGASLYEAKQVVDSITGGSSAA